MNHFVEECRSEWKRLGVADPVADEMAAELAADLEEADAEGASAEEVLGSGAFDPRSFATSWAAERGVIQRPLPSGHGVPRRSRMAASIGAFALLSIIGAVLVILASPPAPERRLVLGSPPSASERRLVLAAPVVLDYVAQPVGVVSARIDVVDMNDSDTRTVGWVLLIVGLAGVVPSTMFWLWVGPGRWSPRRTDKY